MNQNLSLYRQGKNVVFRFPPPRGKIYMTGNDLNKARSPRRRPPADDSRRLGVDGVAVAVETGEESSETVVVKVEEEASFSVSAQYARARS